MKKNFYLLLVSILGLMGIISSCEDKETFPPKVSLDTTQEYSVKIKDTIWLKPEVESAINATYTWYVNDIESCTEEVFPFTQKENGTYDIKLVVSNHDGETECNIQVLVRGQYFNGTYIIVQGGMSDNGRLGFIDEDGNFTNEAYYKANGSYVGNILQDIYVHNGEIYMICQNGPDQGGDGYLVIADAETLKKKRVINEGGIENEGIWPQHIVVINDNKAYIQYSTSGMEENSGIKILDIKSGTLSAEDIEGTYGKFTVEGASKMRMLYTDGKVFAPCGHSLAVINTESDEIVKRIEFTSQIKDIVKGHDGNLWMTVAGEYTPNAWSPIYTGAPKIVGINPSTYEIVKVFSLNSELTTPVLESNPFTNEFNLSASPASPSIGMCASQTEDAIYFCMPIDMYYGTYDTYKFNYKTGSLEEIVTLRNNRGLGNTMYGYVGVDKNDNLYIGATNYTWSKISVYDAKTGERKDITDKEMDLDGDDKIDNYYYIPAGTPSGIDFTFRFN